MNIENIIASELNIKIERIKNALSLLIDQGCTIPFVSRYRKEATEGLNEEELEKILDKYHKLEELSKRRTAIIASITEQGAMTPELLSKIEACLDINRLEDIYLPFKPKRRTRATIAKEKGYEPLAATMMSRGDDDVERQSTLFADSKDAINGAMDILAEWISENEKIRDIVRTDLKRNGTVISKVVKKKEGDAAKYSNYFDFSESIRRIAPNRYLAICRGENEGLLKVSLSTDVENITDRLINFYNKYNRCSSYKISAIKDSYKRLISPSIENEVRATLKEESDEKAIKIFTVNLRQLLLASPLGGKRVLALDPGFRTGCKVVCLSELGDLLINDTVYPHAPQNDKSTATRKIENLLNKYRIEVIAVGNGTAGRESEEWLSPIAKERGIQLFSVSEDGASVYSASSVAREEFPDYDVTVRGAVSIGRRLIDPMAELVKIDPKSIGVGEYQHDVDQTKLKNSLDNVVESCVSSVGVNLNTASYHVLTYVSGIGKNLAKKITEYRTENGEFRSRKELLKVPRLGAKVFEQAAGFLRIPNGVNPLDNSSVHPESYYLIELMAKNLKVSTKEMVGNRLLIDKIDAKQYITKEVGEITITELLKELAKPVVDPRGEAEAHSFADDIHTIDDLTVGRELDGIVTNITSFGAFVDIGVKQDGLVHISNMSNRFISSPNEVVSLQQKIRVQVLEIDYSRKRIALTMKF